MVGLLFHAPVFARPLWLAALLAAGTIGFASVGTLFAAMLVRARSRDVLLPVLLYPITIPVIIAGVRGTAAMFQATPDEPMVAVLGGAARVLRRGVRHALAVDVRTADDGVAMSRAFVPLVLIAAVLFASAPLVVANAPVRADDGAGAEDLLLPRAVGDADVRVGVRLRHRQRRVSLPAAAGGGPGRAGGRRAGRAVRPHRPGDRARSGRARPGACGGSGTRG